ncbi:hypothetical protein GEMRC1_005321 [Eukaryota sp. GEM-RC1]
MAGLLAVNKEAIIMTLRFSSILLMDATYKTNQLGIPLFAIVGIDCFLKSFTAAFAFIMKEDIESYVWALSEFNSITQIDPIAIMRDRDASLANAICTVYPNAKHLLCYWHLERNIKGHRSSENYARFSNFLFDLRNVASCNDELGTIQLLNQFWIKYEQDEAFRNVLEYLRSSIMPECEKFFHCYLTDVLHLGTFTNNRAEGNHSVLKRYKSMAQQDLLGATKKIDVHVRSQLQDFNILVDRDQFFNDRVLSTTDLFS